MVKHVNEAKMDHFLATNLIENAKIGATKQVISTPIKTDQAFLEISSLSDKLMLRHGGKP